MSKTKNKFRASFGVLDAWRRGDWQMAVEMYFKVCDFETPAMIEGKEYHKQWEEEIQKNKRLPLVFGGEKLVDPKPEIKLFYNLNDWLDLVGIIDCYDQKTIHEFKTGVTTSQSYANGMQIGVYALLLKLHGYQVNQGVVHRYNQHMQKADASYVWITKDYMNKALDWVETYSSEMHNYLEANDLYKKLN